MDRQTYFTEYARLGKQLEKDISQILYNVSEFKEIGAPDDEMDEYAKYIIIRARVEGAKTENDLRLILDVLRKGLDKDVSSDIWPLIVRYRDETDKLLNSPKS
jgi:hypothetical protein